jgi:hypothetical protein
MTTVTAGARGQDHASVRAALTLLGALLLLAVAVQSVASTGASLWTRTFDPANLFAAGKVVLGNDKKGALIVDAPYLRPGESSPTATVTLSNGGDVRGAVTVTRDTVADTPTSPSFSSIVRLAIVDDATGRPSTRGPCGAWAP